MTYEEAIKELLLLIWDGAKTFGDRITKMIESKVTEWVESQHRFYGLLEVFLNWES